LGDMVDWVKSEDGNESNRGPEVNPVFIAVESRE
jgi:hypothetical protein